MTGWQLHRAVFHLALLPVALVATAAHARPDPAVKAARDCRKQTAHTLTTLTKEGLEALDECHKKRNACRKDDTSTKCASIRSADCNALAIALSDADRKTLTKKCPGSNLELLVYPSDLDGVLATITEQQVHTSGGETQGSVNLADDSRKDPQKKRHQENRKCHDTIGRQRSTLANKVLARAVKCQQDVDKSASTFGERNAASCTRMPSIDTLKAKAKDKIMKACTRADGTAITATDVGTCDAPPTNAFPDCVTNSALSLAELLANNAYTLVSSCSYPTSSLSTQRGIFQILRRFFFFRRSGPFGGITKIPRIYGRQLVRRVGASRAGTATDPMPAIAVNRSPFLPGGGRSFQVKVASAAVTNKRLRISVAGATDACNVDVFEIDLAAALATTSNSRAGGLPDEVLELEAEFETAIAPTNVTIRMALVDSTGNQTSDASEVTLERRGLLALVQDLNDGVGSSDPHSLTAVGSRLFFVAHRDQLDQIWVAEGDPPTLQPLSSPSGGTFRDLTAVGDKLFFGHCPSNVESGCSLWSTAGTDPSTIKISDVPSSCADSPAVPVAANGKLIFTSPGKDGLGCELWVSDGTGSGTTRVNDIATGRVGSKPRELTPLPLNPNVFFVADEFNATSRQQIWKTDGAPNTTVARTTFAPGIVLGEVTAFNDQIYFVADDTRLYRLNPASGGPTLVPPPFTGISQLTPAKEALYFEGCDTANGCELWRLGKGSVDPERVSNIAPGTEDAFVGDLIPVGGDLYFRACSPLGGCEVWRTDGTSDGTRQVADVAPGAASSFPTDLATIAGRVFFEATDGARGREIWETDGTPNGTVRVRDFSLGQSSGFGGTPLVVGNRLFFPRRAEKSPDVEDDTGEELWSLRVFDGTTPPPTPTPGNGATKTPTPLTTVTPGTGNCCVAHGADQPGCDSGTCASCVCGLDPACCDSTWDTSCATHAAQECLANCSCSVPTTPTPTATITPNPLSKCCEAGARRSCEIPQCAQTVCTDDPFCCGSENGFWDNVCAQAAKSNPDCGCPTPTPSPTATLTPTPTLTKTPTPKVTPTPVLPHSDSFKFTALVTGVGAGTRHAPDGTVENALQYGLNAATFDLNRPPLLRCQGGISGPIECKVDGDCLAGGSCTDSRPNVEDSNAFLGTFDCSTRSNTAGGNATIDGAAAVSGSCPSAVPQHYRIEIALGLPMSGQRSAAGGFVFRIGANPAVGSP